jgi:hypothetical protein
MFFYLIRVGDKSTCFYLLTFSGKVKSDDLKEKGQQVMQMFIQLSQRNLVLAENMKMLRDHYFLLVLVMVFWYCFRKKCPDFCYQPP